MEDGICSEMVGLFQFDPSSLLRWREVVCDYSPLKLGDTVFGMYVAFSHPVIPAIPILLFFQRIHTGSGGSRGSQMQISLCLFLKKTLKTTWRTNTSSIPGSCDSHQPTSKHLKGIWVGHPSYSSIRLSSQTLRAYDLGNDRFRKEREDKTKSSKKRRQNNEEQKELSP